MQTSSDQSRPFSYQRQRRAASLRRKDRVLTFEHLEWRRLLTSELVSATPFPPPISTGELPAGNPVISANGRYVAFQSAAADLDDAVVDSNDSVDVFVRDVTLDRTALISVASVGGKASNGVSLNPAISDDGRFVAFVSTSTDLVKDGVIDSPTNVFVRDRDADRNGIFDESAPGATVTRLLSISTDETSGDGPSGGAAFPFVSSLVMRPVISGNGAFVAFASAATDLALDDPALTDLNGVETDVFRSSITGGAMTLISRNAAETGSGVGPFSSRSENPSISATGSIVAFQSDAADLVTAAEGDVDDDNLSTDIFVRSGRSVDLVSINTDKTGSADGASREPVISRNGRHVAFISKARDLVRGTDANGFAEDVFVRDLRAGITTLVSRSRAIPGPLTTGDGASPPGSDTEFIGGPSISDTGRFVAFRSAATDLLDPAEGVVDDNGFPDVFVFDRDSDLDGVFDEVDGTRTILVSVNSLGTASTINAAGTAGSFSPTISGDGRYVAFGSNGTDLIPGVDGANIYVRDLVTGTTALVSATISGEEGGPPGPSATGRTITITPSGSRIGFISDTLATDLDPAVTSDVNSASGAADVFVNTPPADIRVLSFLASGFTSGAAAIGTFFESVGPIPVGIYRSADETFDAADELIDTTTFVPGPGFGSSASSLTTLIMPYVIGDGADELIFPGAGMAETDADYFILLVADNLNEVSEFDSDPFVEDNTGLFSVAYHEPSGPVFIHGREGATEASSADTIVAAATGTDLTVTFTGAIRRTLTYSLADVTGLRIRAHGGDDKVTGSPLADFIHGGAGSDTIDGGAGDDVLFGGPGADTLIGGPGVDLFVDGAGDDTIISDEEDETAISTPGSDDVFIDHGGSDTIDFSRDDQPITLDLDSTAVQRVDPLGNTVQLIGHWENFVGSPFGNRVYLRPLSVPRHLNGGVGPDDRLIFDALGLPVTFDGTRFQIPGLGDITVDGFEHIQTLNAPRIIDDSDGAPAFSAPGFFPGPGQGFDGGVLFSGANSGNTATWRFIDVAPGIYAVSGTWTFAGDRAKNSPFTIRDGGPTGTIARSLAVNQEQNPGEFDPPEDGQNILFRNLAIVAVTGHELTVQLTDVGADQFVSADAIRIEPISTSLIIDDGDAGFSTGGFAPPVLANNAAGRGTFGDGQLGQKNGDNAMYEFDVSPGLYSVSAAWTAGRDRASNAPFRITDDGVDVLTGIVNQQNPPDDFVEGEITWKRLGNFEVGPDGTIQFRWLVETNTDGVVVADAVRLDPACGVKLTTMQPFGLVELQAEETFFIQDDFRFTRDQSFNFGLRYENVGSAECNLGSVDVTGTGFSLSRDFGSFVVPPGGTTDFEITFEASELGIFNGALSFNTNAFGLNPFKLNLQTQVVNDTIPPEVLIREINKQYDTEIPLAGISQLFSNNGAFYDGSVEATDDISIGTSSVHVRFVGPGYDKELSFVPDFLPTPTMVRAFRFPGPFPVGQYTLTATATDTAGNVGSATPILVEVVAAPPPAIEFASPAAPGVALNPAAVENSTLPVELVVADESKVERVELSANGVVFATLSDEPLVAQFVVPRFVAGQNNIVLRARAFDFAGNVGEATLNLTVFRSPIMTNSTIVVGPGAGPNLGPPPPVRVFDGTAEVFRFLPYGAGFTGGVRVATGDVNGDGVPDIITGAGSGSGPHVKAFDGRNATEIRSFFAYPGTFAGGVFVASGDVNNDGFDDIITGAGAGAPGGHVKVFSGQNGAEIQSFFAFPGFLGGVSVGSGDVNRDGIDDVIVGAGPGAPGGHVKVFHGQTAAEVHSFFAFPGFAGGVFVAGGDVNSDGFDDVIVGTGSGAPGGHVKAFSGSTTNEIQSFFAFSGFTGGVSVGAGDVNGDGRADLLAAVGPGAGPHVKVFGLPATVELASFFAYEPTWPGGLFIAGGVAPRTGRMPLPPGGGVFELLVAGNDAVLRRAGGAEVSRVPLTDQDVIVVDGTDNSNDTLNVVLDGLPIHVAFHGGLLGHDTLGLSGGGFDRVTHYFAGPDRGTIDLDGQNIAYTGLEPIVDNVSAIHRVFVANVAGDQQIRLIDDASANDGVMTLDASGSGAFESVTFAVPPGSLAIHSNDNSDTVTIGPLDTQFTGSLEAHGGAGDDTIVVTALDLVFALFAGAGRDVARLFGSGVKIDLSDEEFQDIHDLEELDIVGQGANELVVTRVKVLDITDATNTLAIRHNQDDTVRYDPSWIGVSKQVVDDDEFLHVFQNGDATLQIINTRFWQNPTNRLDVTADGFVVPNDVLRIINLLNSVGSVNLTTLPAGADIPYVDVQPDNILAPLDALAIINFLNALSAGEGESSLIAAGETQLALLNRELIWPVDRAGACQVKTGCDSSLPGSVHRSPPASATQVWSSLRPSSRNAAIHRPEHRSLRRVTDPLFNKRIEKTIDELADDLVKQWSKPDFAS